MQDKKLTMFNIEAHTPCVIKKNLNQNLNTSLDKQNWNYYENLLIMQESEWGIMISE